MSSTLDDFVAEVMSYIAPRKCGGPSTVRVKLFNMMRDISAVRNWADEMAAVMKAEMEEYQTHRKEVLGLIDLRAMVGPKVQEGYCGPPHRKVLVVQAFHIVWKTLRGEVQCCNVQRCNSSCSQSLGTG
ncbi:hypothetical protein COOONC_02981 [Cooperia oncophora]